MRGSWTSLTPPITTLRFGLPWHVWRTIGTIPASRVMQQKIDESMEALEERIRSTVVAGLGLKRRTALKREAEGYW